MKSKSSFKTIIGIFIAFMLGGLLMYYIILNSNTLTIGASSVAGGSSGSNCRACSSTVIVNDGSLSSAVEKVYDAVVMIRNYNGDQVISTGSGFVYKTDSKYGYVLTNHHVIDGAEKTVLIRSDDKEIEGEVLGSDEYLDLAVVRINKSDVIR